ncbi:hypothetical protein [Nocardia australiensis]|uniref:hypothetical protein n=1 Tax=Nocardia australiensis TaxID=2887191 RepID=UPI001D15E255|nr:hypothetical protein [Nocardia australiensis]
MGQGMPGGESVGDGYSAGDENGIEAQRYADLAAARLLYRPADAEQHLRQALSIGASVLPAEQLARLSSQLVMVISGQPGRELELAVAAMNAAARWEPISDADAVHLSFVAARALHRAGRDEAAVAVFEPPIMAGKTPYPAAEMAVVRGQYAQSLRRLGRFRAAAQQFAEGARLVREDPSRVELRADLIWAAAIALDNCDEDAQALVAYLRAARLWGTLGRVGARARCLRSAAWAQRWSLGADADDRPWLTTMGALLAELEQLAVTAPSTEIANELVHTRSQLADMRQDDDDQRGRSTPPAHRPG